MMMRIFVAFFIFIAVLVGIFALILSREHLIRLIIFRDFFDVAIPILAFGALIKYLCSMTIKCEKCGNQNKLV